MSNYRDPPSPMSRSPGDPNYEAGDIRTQFATREGVYKFSNCLEYAKSNRVSINNGPCNVGGINNGTILPVKVSLIQANEMDDGEEKLCFNYGREVYVYPFHGLKKGQDNTIPIDKRLYRGTSPTCHDFNHSLRDKLHLVIGFSAGQIQLIYPISKENSKLFNEDRSIDSKKVTCIKWLPNSSNKFLVAHASGNLYIYDEDLPCGPSPPNYQLFKGGDNFSVHTCKSRSTRNPMYKWTIDGCGSVNEFAFSPCSRFVAMACQDGFLKVFNFDHFEFISQVKSYFGGFLCVCWSPDGKYIVLGGEDDLVTVYSFLENRVVCRGRGHSSWVNVVAFDPFNSFVEGDLADLSDEDEEDDVCRGTYKGMSPESIMRGSVEPRKHRRSRLSSSYGLSISENEPSITEYYRFGSAGQDTKICLWDLTEDVLKQTAAITTATTTSCNSVAASTFNTLPVSGDKSNKQKLNANATFCQPSTVSNTISTSSTTPSKPTTLTTNATITLSSNCLNTSSTLSSSSGSSAQLTCHSNSSNDNNNTTSKSNENSMDRKSSSTTPKKSKKKNKSYRTSTLPNIFSRKNNSNNNCIKPNLKPSASLSTNNQNNNFNSNKTPFQKHLGSSICPGLNQIPLIEPLTCKRISRERINSLIFLTNSLLVSDQDGQIFLWSRPTNRQNFLNNPTNNNTSVPATTTTSNTSNASKMPIANKFANNILNNLSHTNDLSTKSANSPNNTTILPINAKPKNNYFAVYNNTSANNAVNGVNANDSFDKPNAQTLNNDVFSNSNLTLPNNIKSTYAITSTSTTTTITTSFITSNTTTLTTSTSINRNDHVRKPISNLTSSSNKLSSVKDNKAFPLLNNEMDCNNTTNSKTFQNNNNTKSTENSNNFDINKEDLNSHETNITASSYNSKSTGLSDTNNISKTNDSSTLNNNNNKDNIKEFNEKCAVSF